MISSASHKLSINIVCHHNTSYDESLRIIIDKINLAEENSLILAPELVFTGFDYENMDKASEFTRYVLRILLELVGNKIFVFTAIVKKDNGFENEAFVLHNHKIVHRQSKSRLFALGKEEKHFVAGKSSDIIPFKINSIKYAILICFEIRFKELWRAVEGVDVILVPAQWGVLRQKHIIRLCSALAIMNQCFVVIVSSGESGISELSKIYNPEGDTLMLNKPIDANEVIKMRRYINMGCK